MILFEIYNSLNDINNTREIFTYFSNTDIGDHKYCEIVVFLMSIKGNFNYYLGFYFIIHDKISETNESINVFNNLKKTRYWK